MSLYRSPESGTSLSEKFIRVERNVFIGGPTHRNHTDIAQIDKLAGAIEQLRKTNPAEIDAGFVDIIQGVVYISDDSPTLGLPVYRFHKQAREITLRDFTEQSPNHTVRGLGK